MTDTPTDILVTNFDILETAVELARQVRDFIDVLEPGDEDGVLLGTRAIIARAILAERSRAASLIESQAIEIRELREDKEQAERNRDMWKGQCERQTKQLELRTLFFDFVYRWAWEKDGNGTSDTEKLSAIKYHPILKDWAERARALNPNNPSPDVRS